MLESGFIILSLLVAGFLGWLISNSIAGKGRGRTFVFTFVFLGLWMAVISGLALKGIFTVESFPPRIPLLLVFPAFGFIIYFFRADRFSSIIQNTSPAAIVCLQGFRVFVELLLLGLFLDNKVTKDVTFEGFNYDILIGITAPLVAWLISKRKINRSLLLIWNIAGLVTLSVVVFLFMTQAYFPSFWHLQAGILGRGIGIFPFTLLPGFLMPVAVFLHVFSISKLKNKI